MTNMKVRQLRILLNDFELLSKTALLQWQIVSKILNNGYVEELVEEALANEVIIDRLEIKIREEVVFAIFQFTPKAADLRKIITYQDITTNIERVGDMLLNIIGFCRETNMLQPEFASVKKLIDKMLEYTGEMLRNSIYSFSKEDTEMAYQVLKEDDKVDELFHQIKVSLQKTYANKSLTEENIKDIINIDTISHNLERIGDSATNIAESTIYLTEGRDIRHGNK